MRAFTVSTTSLVLSSALFLAGCGGASLNSREGPFAPPPPPRPLLFISPFGEPFTARAGETYPSAAWFAGADRDGDGAVTFEEFSADGLRWFAVLDTDRDGRLNQTELAAYEVSLRDLGAGLPMGGRPGPGGDDREGDRRMDGPAGMGDALLNLNASTLGVAPQNRGGSRVPAQGGGRSRGYGPIAEAGFFNLPQPVKSADTNIDQRVSAEEWAAATQRWFQALDTDRDGKLTLATLPVTPAQAAAARRR